MATGILQTTLMLTLFSDVSLDLCSGKKVNRYTEREGSVTSTRCVKAHYLVRMFTVAPLQSGIRHSLSRQRQFSYEQRKAKKKPCNVPGVEVFMHEPFSVFPLCKKEQRWPST